MKCLLPLGNINAPEGDISKCSGELKEEMQSLIIQKLHAYILDNLGKISSEMENIVKNPVVPRGNQSSRNVTK